MADDRKRMSVEAILAWSFFGPITVIGIIFVVVVLIVATHYHEPPPGPITPACQQDGKLVACPSEHTVP